MKSIASKINLPIEFLDVRNECTHRTLPTLQRLITTARQVLLSDLLIQGIEMVKEDLLEQAK